MKGQVSRFTDLVMPHGISGAKLGSGLFSKNVAGRRRPAERAAKLRAVLAGSTKLSEADAFRKRSPARPAVALSGSAICAKGSRLWRPRIIPKVRYGRRARLNATKSILTVHWHRVKPLDTVDCAAERSVCVVVFNRRDRWTALLLVSHSGRTPSVPPRQ